MRGYYDNQLTFSDLDRIIVHVNDAVLAYLSN